MHSFNGTDADGNVLQIALGQLWGRMDQRPGSSVYFPGATPIF